MKQLIVLIGLFILVSFTPTKEYVATGTVDQWNELLLTVEQSNAPHTQVVRVQQWLIPQLQKQAVADTTKKK